MGTSNGLILAESLQNQYGISVHCHIMGSVQETQEPHELIVHELEVFHAELLVQVVQRTGWVQPNTEPHAVDRMLPNPGIRGTVAPVDDTVRVLGMQLPHVLHEVGLRRGIVVHRDNRESWVLPPHGEELLVRAGVLLGPQYLEPFGPSRHRQDTLWDILLPVRKLV